MLHCLDSSILILERSLNSHAHRQMILLRYLMNCVMLHYQVMAKMVMVLLNFVINAKEESSGCCLGYGMSDLKVLLIGLVQQEIRITLRKMNKSCGRSFENFDKTSKHCFSTPYTRATHKQLFHIDKQNTSGLDVGHWVWSTVGEAEQVIEYPWLWQQQRIQQARFLVLKLYMYPSKWSI